MECTDMERRILDMWPKFEDGAYVQLGDKAVANSGENSGKEFTVRNVYFENGHGKLRSSALDGCYWNWKSADTRVKRPAPKVLDADGVEIKVGDRVFSIENGNSYIVRSVNGNGTLEFEGFEYKGWFPTIFTHMQPAIDADGVLIKVGDTVWHEDGRELRVIGFDGMQDGETVLIVEYAAEPTKLGEVRCLSVSHTNPDSWERLEKDATMSPWSYCDKYGLVDRSDGEFAPIGEAFAIDLVRRAKAIAEKEAAR